jgi:dipeptidyl aminopeptidase/acylaminoacyl peptidase
MRKKLPRSTGLALAGVALLVASAHEPVGAQAATTRVGVVHAPTFDDLLALRQFADLAVSADGRWVAYTTSAPFGTGGVSYAHTASGHITLLDLRRHVTRVVNVPGQPHALKWSPRGSTLAFLAPSNGRSGMWRYAPLETTPPQSVTPSDSIGGEILAFTWSPAGDSIAYIAREPGAPGGRVDSAHAPPRLVLFRDAPDEISGPTSPGYSKDSAGAYLAVTGIGSDRSRVLARHVISAQYGPTVDWSRTGMLLVGGAPIGVAWWAQLTIRPLYTLDPRTGAVRQVRPERPASMYPTWSPSGRWIAYQDYEVYPAGSPLGQRRALGLDDPSRADAERTLLNGNGGLAGTLPPVWGSDDHTLYNAWYERGTARLFAIDVDARRWRAITPDTLSVSHYAVTRDGKAVLAVLENANQPQQLYRIDAATGALTQLTHEARALPSMRLGRVEQLEWPSSDGRFTVHGFLVKPPDYDSARRYPLIVLVHGGPGAFFTNSFVAVGFSPGYLPAQLLASAGYLVLLPNPRGDAGYGEAFEAALHGDWGPGPFGDINAGVSALIARGLADSTALGIGGASYGGYLTAYTITQTTRFGAASINDGPTDLAVGYGQNYAMHANWLGHFFGGTPWTRPDVYAAQSPITYVSQVRTPVLMRYGGRSVTHDNVRQAYMLTQGFEFYAGLHDNNVPVEFVLHPDQGHGIADWGLYKDWVGRNLRWFDYWLRDEGTLPSGTVE